MILLSDQLEAASKSLLRSQNADGGIDATKVGDTSGCWTTASALWSLIRAHCLTYTGTQPLLSMVEFLCKTQVQTGDDRGGWPMMPGAAACAMATGHSLGALQAAITVFTHDASVTDRIKVSIQLGVQWLEKWQNSDGGWSPQPGAGGSVNISTMFATFYAMLPFWKNSPIDAKTQLIRARGIKYILDSRHPNGSWGSSGSSIGEVSDTARALITLAQCDGNHSSSKIQSEAVRYIVSQQSPKGLWPLGRVEVLFPKSGGMTVFSNNRTMDSLVALTYVAKLGRTQQQALTEGLKWLLASQEASTGAWLLSSPYDPSTAGMHTWPTTEWLFAISRVSSAYAELVISGSRVEKGSIVLKVMYPIGLLVSAAVAWNLSSAWAGLSVEAKNFILGTIVVGILINFASAFMQTSFTTWFYGIRDRFSGRSSSE